MQDASRLDDYRILAELARGGMATVYLAVYEGSARPREIVAIKVVHPHLAFDPDFIAMLGDEARIASSIGHPNVVEIREFVVGRADGRNYLVMEYADGETLSMFLKAASKGRPLAWDLAASIAADAAGGLHAAHELRGAHGEPLNLVHRDVSPQNIIVTYEGRVKLTDFGVAKATGRIQKTQPGEIKGKLAYMSPEQAFGRDVDRRSDVYALGVVLYELALGRRLFGGRNDAETIKNIIQHTIVPPREVDPSFPEGLEQIILAMLHKDPPDRFQTAGAVERALRGWLASVGAVDLGARLGDFVRSLDPERFQAKQELLRPERAKLPPPAPKPATPPADDNPTLVAGQLESFVREMGLQPRASRTPEPRPSIPARMPSMAPQWMHPPTSPAQGALADDGPTMQSAMPERSSPAPRVSSPPEFAYQPPRPSSLPAPPRASMAPLAAPPSAPSRRGLWIALVAGLVVLGAGASAVAWMLSR